MSGRDFRLFLGCAVVLFVAEAILLMSSRFAPAYAAVLLLIAPLLAGLAAGRATHRPVAVGATSCLLAAMGVVLLGYAIEPAPPLGRDAIPVLFLLSYSAIVGGIGAWIASRSREQPEVRPMQYYRVEPEVAGGWAENSVFTRAEGERPIIHRLHYRFDGWMGDELLTSTPCFIVTERLADEIKRARLTGIRFAEVEVSKSELFEQLHGNRALPRFAWMQVARKAGRDDFGLTEDALLVVSERAMNVIGQSSISHAEIMPYIDST